MEVDERRRLATRGQFVQNAGIPAKVKLMRSSARAAHEEALKDDRSSVLHSGSCILFNQYVAYFVLK